MRFCTTSTVYELVMEGTATPQRHLSAIATPSLWPHTQMNNNNFRLISIAVAFIMQKTYIYLINSFRKPVNLENSARIRLFCHTPTPSFFLHPFGLDIIFGVLCRYLQTCQSLVFDGVIGHRCSTWLLPLFLPIVLRYSARACRFASFSCDSDFLTFIGSFCRLPLIF